MNRKHNVPFASRRELVTSIALACLNITIFGLFCEFTEINKAVLAVGVVLIYLLEVASLGILRKRQQTAEPNAGMHDILLETSSTVIKNTTQPISTFDEDGKILWCNDAMLSILKLEENPIGMTIDCVFGNTIAKDRFESNELIIRNRIYKAESFILSDRGAPI